MNVMSRLLSGLFVFTALLLTLTSLSVDWLIELYEPTDPFGNRISLIESHRKSEQLSREIALSMERIRAKEKGIQGLLDGQKTLFEVASLFRSLHQDPQTWHDPRHPRPEFEDGESWCRQVIVWVETRLHSRVPSSQGIAVRQQLEAELQKERQRHGKVSLPD
jgi:hypothetical protein